MSQASEAVKSKEKLPNIMTSFVNGAKKGTNMVFQVVIPNIIFAMALMKLLTLSGIIDILGLVLSPVMGIFGLPGQAAMPLVLSFVSISGGITSTAALALDGLIDSNQVLMMIPFIMLVGSTVAMYSGRIMGVVNLDGKAYKLVYLATIITGILSLFLMRILINFI